jgi:hypothetical protein
MWKDEEEWKIYNLEAYDKEENAKEGKRDQRRTQETNA